MLNAGTIFLHSYIPGEATNDFVWNVFVSLNEQIADFWMESFEGVGWGPAQPACLLVMLRPFYFKIVCHAISSCWNLKRRKRQDEIDIRLEIYWHWFDPDNKNQRNIYSFNRSLTFSSSSWGLTYLWAQLAFLPFFLPIVNIGKEVDCKTGRPVCTNCQKIWGLNQELASLFKGFSSQALLTRSLVWANDGGGVMECIWCKIIDIFVYTNRTNRTYTDTSLGYRVIFDEILGEKHRSPFVRSFFRLVQLSSAHHSYQWLVIWEYFFSLDPSYL